MREQADHEAAPEATAAAAPPLPAPSQPLAARVLAMQRAAGNAAVNRVLAREPQLFMDDTPSSQRKDEPIKGWDGPLNLPMPWELGPKIEPVKFPDPLDYVFIMGAEDDKALQSAKRFYGRTVSFPFGRVVARGDKDFEPTFEGIFKYLQQVKWPIRTITIVSHGGADGTLVFPLDRADRSGKLEPAELHEYVQSDRMPKLDPGTITPKTKVYLKACFVGNNQEVVDDMDLAFGHGIGTALATKVKIGYDSHALTNEGLTGWWVSHTKPLKPGEVAYLLKEKYGGRVTLGSRISLKGPNVGKEMTEDEKWIDMAEKAEHHVSKKGMEMHTYIAAAYVEQPSDAYEDDATIYTKSGKEYSPTEL